MLLPSWFAGLYKAIIFDKKVQINLCQQNYGRCIVWILDPQSKKQPDLETYVKSMFFFFTQVIHNTSAMTKNLKNLNF